jgi:hypothetical protein
MVYLQAISGRQLTKVEEPFWKERLSKYPNWKLQRIHEEYSGPFNDKLLVFLDALRPAPGDSVYNPQQICDYGDPEMGLFYMRTGKELLMMNNPRLTSSQLNQALYWLMKIQFPEWELKE